MKYKQEIKKKENYKKEKNYKKERKMSDVLNARIHARPRFALTEFDQFKRNKKERNKTLNALQTRIKKY